MAPGEYSTELEGNGHVAFRFSPAQPASVHALAVYQYYVATPTLIAAATSAVAMSSPLAVTVER